MICQDCKHEHDVAVECAEYLTALIARNGAELARREAELELFQLQIRLHKLARSFGGRTEIAYA